MKTDIRSSSISAFIISAFLISACAPPMSFRSGDVEVLSGTSALQHAETLATAAGGPSKGLRSASLETVALFEGNAMPTGVTVSQEGRIFLSFPRWGDAVNYTAVELRDGTLVPFPDAATNDFRPKHPYRKAAGQHLVSVQSLVIDAKNRLWLLDPGSVNLAPVINGAPKLWGYDLRTGKQIKAIGFPNDVALKRSYLNDVRFDLKRGKEGVAYITDSGMGGIVVVDLASGNSWRHLDDHESVKATPGLMLFSEGEPFLLRKPTEEAAAPDIRSDGIALCPDGRMLYYTPLASRKLYAVPTNLLAKSTVPEAEVQAAVKKIAEKPSASDGILCDSSGFIYTTDWEDNAIRRIDPATGAATIVVQDERLLWPDTLALHDGYLYIVNNQLARQPHFHYGKDKRKPPYALFRVPVG